MEFVPSPAMLLRAKISSLQKVFRFIISDINEYSLKADGTINMNECDLAHFNLQPMDDEWNDMISLENTLTLPRAIKLRTHVLMASTYRKNLDLYNLLQQVSLVTIHWIQRDRDDLVNSVKAIFALEAEVNTGLRKFACAVERTRNIQLFRGECDWSKNSLHAVCARVAEIADEFVKGRGTHVLLWRPESELSRLCNHCREFGLKSVDLVEKLYSYFKVILFEYYIDPYAAKNTVGFREAVRKSKEILSQFDYNITIDIVGMYFATFPLPKCVDITRDFNVSMCKIYDSVKFPDDEANGLQVMFLISRPLPEQERYKDRNCPLLNSMTKICMNH